VLDASDVVRHRLVGDIVDAYGRWDAKERARVQRRRDQARAQGSSTPVAGAPESKLDS
jgi:phosphate starvation-inducible PhoH-like protein